MPPGTGPALDGRSDSMDWLTMERWLAYVVVLRANRWAVVILMAVLLAGLLVWMESAGL